MTVLSQPSYQNKKKYLELYKMVVKHMMHGPCGSLNPTHAQRVVPLARITILDLTTRLHHMARIPTLYIEDVKMVVE
jgi:hypothetical protein